MPEQRTEQKSIWVYIKLAGDGFANSSEFDLRYAIEDAIIDDGIGDYEGAGSGGGWMDVSFGVDNIHAVSPALIALKKLFDKYNVPEEIIRLSVATRIEEICDVSPQFQAGDCLSFRFEDGDFGAALVLKQTFEGLLVDKTLLALMDYKSHLEAAPEIFERRQWLISTHESRKGQPYLVWLDCYGGTEVEVVHHIPLQNDDPMDCTLYLSWEDIPENFINAKYADDKERNPYHPDLIDENLPQFEAGDCLSFRYADGDFGATLVLEKSDQFPTNDGALFAILDYKAQQAPSLSVFEKRNWLIDTHEWRKDTPCLIWAKHCYSKACKELETEHIGRIEIKETDPSHCQLMLFRGDIPEYLALIK